MLNFLKNNIHINLREDIDLIIKSNIFSRERKFLFRDTEITFRS